MENSSVYPIILSSKAQLELASSWEWYEEREPGLGDKLVEDVMQKLDIIQHAPILYPIKIRSYREIRTNVFPFIIIYKINEHSKMIEVVSIFHTSRNPKLKY